MSTRTPEGSCFHNTIFFVAPVAALHAKFYTNNSIRQIDEIFSRVNYKGFFKFYKFFKLSQVAANGGK